MAFQSKGQGATEYLVLLAVVLIIALVSIALLGFFPGLSSDARITQSQSYWRGEASPIAIVDYNVISGGYATMVLQNMDASGTYSLGNLSLASSVGSGSKNINESIGPGEKKTINVTTAATGGVGTIYELGINISYNSSYGVSKIEYGSKPLVGKFSACSGQLLPAGLECCDGQMVCPTGWGCFGGCYGEPPTICTDPDSWSNPC